MRIRVLYFEGCPNHRPVVESISRLVQRHGLDADIEVVEVSADDVVRHRFLGSPTIQVDGVDIDPAARERADFAMSCRVYGTPDGLPSEEMLLAALGVKTCGLVLTSGRRTDGIERTGMLAAGGSVASAVLSSACCWLPLLLLSFGASAAGVSTIFERWRPAFIAIALVMLSIGFYLAYFRQTPARGDCCTSRRKGGRRLQRGILWLSVALVAVFIFFPDLVVAFTDGQRDGSAGVAQESRQAIVFDVEGMTCEACATTLRNRLMALEGVDDARVDYDEKRAIIRASKEDVGQRVTEAAARLGYKAARRADKESD